MKDYVEKKSAFLLAMEQDPRDDEEINELAGSDEEDTVPTEPVEEGKEALERARREVSKMDTEVLIDHGKEARRQMKL